LDILLDRSKEAMARKVGWSAGLGAQGADKAAQIQQGEKTAFEVFMPAKDDAADGLASMFNGENSN
jgi:ATP-dependent DNA helicase